MPKGNESAHHAAHERQKADRPGRAESVRFDASKTTGVNSASDRITWSVPPSHDPGETVSNITGWEVVNCTPLRGSSWD
jgi:hypothetical protein